MTNPLLEDWDTPFGLPPFDRIEDDHFRPAFDAALERHRAEIAAIRDSDAVPDFANTLGALERAGRLLERTGSVFFHLVATDSNPERLAIEREIAPRLASHRLAILTDPALFARIEAVRAAGGLDPEQARVAELAHERFVRAGARLGGAARERNAQIVRRLAELGTAFSQNVLKDESGWVLPLDPAGTEGLPPFLLSAAAEAARARGLDGHVITLSRSLIEPFLTYSPRRDLREQAMTAWQAVGEGANWPLIEETLGLRAERAALLGFPSYAAFKLADQMAKTPAAVRGLLEAVWAPALRRAKAEQAAMEALAAEAGQNVPIESWDWRYWAEKVRERNFAFDEAQLKPYLALDRVIEAAFDVANRLFGLVFEPLRDVPLPRPDARAWEVTTEDGTHVGVFVGDYFARANKRSGAWASTLRRQQGLEEPFRPIVLNTCNFPGGDPTLLTWDEARTLFHEFGHGLHQLLSDVTYPSISGTSVPRDFVELPSQLYEHWLAVPGVLATHARHVETGEPMPSGLIARLKKADTFNQGFFTAEFVASAMVDLDMHELPPGVPVDGPALERATLARLGAPPAIPMRHRSPKFQHVFAGDGYSAGYYSYMWSEMMDADAFAAFEATGDPFHRETAERLRANIYSAGNRQDPEAAYVAFRGRMPTVAALLRGRGLDGAV